MYVVMIDYIIYEGISLVGSLRTSTQWVRCHHLLRRINDLIYPVGREPITDMIHLVVIKSCALLLNWSMVRSREEV